MMGTMCVTIWATVLVPTASGLSYRNVSVVPTSGSAETGFVMCAAFLEEPVSPLLILL